MSIFVWSRRLVPGVAAALLAATCWAQSAAAPRVKLITSASDIVLELTPAQAPRTVENFLTYVRKGHYNGTIFHRVIPGFMIQGGGMDSALNPKPTDPPIENEANNGLRNEKYAVAMARTSHPHSATAQFFINVADNHFLNHTSPTPQGWGYAVFGRVIEGHAVVDRIAVVPTGNRGMHQNVPLTPIFIQQATLLPTSK